MIVVLTISVLLGLIFAPLGCLVLWKRYVYLGDGLAHASMLAAVLSITAGIPIIYAGIINTLLFALIVFKLKNKSGNNAAIGLTSSLMISLALILSYIFPGKFNFTSLLFGDIITANSDDIIILIILLAAVLLFFIATYKNLVMTVLSKDIARTRGIKVAILEFVFLAIFSFAVLSTIKIVGALLVTSIILIPAMAARLISNSPSMMIISAIFLAQLMNFGGILVSLYIDIPFAPVIILCGGGLYISILFFQTIKNS